MPPEQDRLHVSIQKDGPSNHADDHIDVQQDIGAQIVDGRRLRNGVSLRFTGARGDVHTEQTAVPDPKPEFLFQESSDRPPGAENQNFPAGKEHPQAVKNIFDGIEDGYRALSGFRSPLDLGDGNARHGKV